MTSSNVLELFLIAALLLIAAGSSVLQYRAWLGPRLRLAAEETAAMLEHQGAIALLDRRDRCFKAAPEGDALFLCSPEGGQSRALTLPAGIGIRSLRFSGGKAQCRIYEDGTCSPGRIELARTGRSIGKTRCMILQSLYCRRRIVCED